MFNFRQTYFKKQDFLCASEKTKQLKAQKIQMKIFKTTHMSLKAFRPKYLQSVQLFGD